MKKKGFRVFLPLRECLTSLLLESLDLFLLLLLFASGLWLGEWKKIFEREMESVAGLGLGEMRRDVQNNQPNACTNGPTFIDID